MIKLVQIGRPRADDEEDYLDCKTGGYMGRRTVESLSSSINYLDNELY